MTSTLFVTGAGISAAAGIATYRGDGGGSSWTDSDLEAKSHASRYGNHLDELWNKHWGPLSLTMLKAEPTVAHKAIAAFQKRNESIVATQNIDNLHERAGSDNVEHVHGVMDVRCNKCKTKPLNVVWDGNGAPECTNCGSRKTRPDVVLFGEDLNRKRFRGLEYFAQTTASHIIVVGSSLWVHPIAGLVMDTLGKVGKTTILINKGEAQFSKWFTEVHDAPADDVIQEVLDRVDAKEKD